MSTNKHDIKHLNKNQLFDILNVQRIWISRLIDCINSIYDNDIDDRYIQMAQLLVEKAENQEFDLDKLLNNKMTINNFIAMHGNIDSIPSFDLIDDDNDEYGAVDDDYYEDDGYETIDSDDE